MIHSSLPKRAWFMTTCLLTGLLLQPLSGMTQAPVPGQGQQTPSMSVNFFSLQQDREIGAESIKVADKELPLVRSLVVNTYVKTIAARLAPYSPLQSINYRIQVVNSKTISTLTYPGGTIYVDRGLLELASNEHEVAAIVAHEIAHAAARHGTQQLSRQWLVQAPASILAGLPGNAGWKDQLQSLGISLNPHPSFLRYSSNQEMEANRIAVQILFKSVYSPYALPAIIEKINGLATAESRVLPAYVYDHPQGTEAALQLNSEIEKLNAVSRILKPSAEFSQFHSTLMSWALPPEVPAPVATDTLVSIPYRHPDAYYKLLYPEGWQATPYGSNGAIIAPVAQGSRRFSNDIQVGVMFDLFDISERPMTLEQATDRLLVKLLQRNPTLQVISGAQPLMLMGGEPALRTVLIGQSESSNSPEISWVVTRVYYQTLFYIVCVAPQKDFEKRQPAFEQILKSIELK
jgi:Zn-dependent protease with chaperone function